MKFRVLKNSAQGRREKGFRELPEEFEVVLNV